MNQVWQWIIEGIAHLVIALKNAVAGMFGRVLATFGLTMVSFEALLPRLKSFVLEFVGGLSGPALEFLGAIGLGQAMSMVMSALTVRLTWKVFIVPKSVAESLQGN